MAYMELIGNTLLCHQYLRGTEHFKTVKRNAILNSIQQN